MSNVRPLETARTLKYKHLLTLLLVTAAVFAITFGLLAHLPDMHRTWRLPNWAAGLLIFLLPAAFLGTFSALIWYYATKHPSEAFLALSIAEQRKALSQIKWVLVLPATALTVTGLVVAVVK